MQLLYAVLILIFLNACSADKEVSIKEIKTVSQTAEVEPEQILDLINIPQIPSIYSQGIDKIALDSEEFEKHYFRPWNIEKFSIELKDAMWAYNVFKYGNSYGENLQLISQGFFDEMLLNSNFTEYSTLNKRAVSLRLLNIRAFPTDKPLLRDPTRAGEGFPFDYMQNSTVAANKPLFVSHYSKDREWVFVETSFAFGWVKASDIVFMEKRYTDLWQEAEQILITKEDVSIYGENEDFLYKSRIGMMFALISEDTQSYTVLTLARDENANAIYLQSKILKQDAHKGVMAFNSENINTIVSQLSQTNYGWGGMHEQRDCSSTLRDFYTPFGIWLPRNSSQQAKTGRSISLHGLSDEEKIILIKRHARPFETLLYKQGHIVLYVGTLNDEVIVFQNVWGVKTDKDSVEGRYVIGKSVFSTLELGKNLKDYDDAGSLLKNLQSLNSPME